jgi:hypothetical protein
MRATRRRHAALVVATSMCVLVGCTHSGPSTPPSATTVTAPANVPAQTMDETTSPDAATTAAGAQPKISSDPAQVADDLVADEQALRDPSTPEPNDRGQAIFRYNNATQYVHAVNDYAAVLAADPGAFTGYYRWDVYYRTTAGDVLLPVGYESTTPIPVDDYLAEHPQ